MATLIRRKTGLYRAQFYDASRTPQRKRVSLKTRNKRTAERFLAKLERDYVLGTYDPWAPAESEVQESEADVRLLGGAVDAYMDSCAHLSPNTLRTYRSIFKLFREHLGASYEVQQISPADLLSFLDSTDAGAVTRRKYLHHLGYLFRFLIRRDAMKRDLSKDVKLPRLPEQAPKSMTPADVDHLIQTIHDHVEATAEDGRVPDYRWLVDIIRANVHLGLRLGEIIHLRWEHVCLQRRTLAVRNTDEFTTKRGKERVLPLSQTAYDVFRKLQEEDSERLWVFTSHMGKLKPHYLSQTFLKFRRMAGLRDGVSFHSTRHTCATWLAERGVPVGVIQELMGHSSVKTTERYMNVRPATTRHWVEQAFGND